MAAPAQVPRRAPQPTRLAGRGSPLAKRTAPIATVRHNVGGRAISRPITRPTLRVVPRRRRAARFAAVVSVVVVSAMMAAAAFQVQLARRQLVLDTLDRSITESRAQYEVLRRTRSELRSPERLAGIAAEAGMGLAGQTRFVDLDPAVVVAVQQSTGAIDQRPRNDGDALLEEYRAVKGLAAGPSEPQP